MRGLRIRQRPDPAGRRHVLGLVAAAVTAALRPVAAAEDRVVRTLALPGGRAIEIAASIAAVHVTGSARDDVRLEVVRTAPRAADLDRFPLVVDEDATRVRIAVVQAGTDAQLQATLRLEVPAAARITALRIAEGRLEAVDLRGTLTADVRRGPIVATRMSGTLRLETGIGAIDVRQARLIPGGLIRLRTFNGDVRLAFSDVPTDARLMALALNGTVTSQVPLTLKTGWGPRWGEATLGAGAPVVSIDVVSGDIVIEAPAGRG